MSDLTMKLAQQLKNAGSSALDYGAEWGRGVQGRAKDIASALMNPGESFNKLSNWPKIDLSNAQMPSYEQKRQMIGKAVDMVLNAGGAMPLATVWHGSPHLFNKFDMSKIGTGEGAQAYGHGLYLAENPKVAQGYKDQLSPKKVGKDSTGVKGWADWATSSADDSNHAMKMIDDLAKQSSKEPPPKGFADWVSFSEAVKNETKSRFGGALYKVDLPDDHINKMIDWDMSLTQQSPEVRKAISSALEKHKLSPASYADSTGGEIYKDLAWEIGGTKGQEAATNLLKKRGVSGIKYLDANSRLGDQGTRNFVVFDDSLPKIIGRE